MNEQTNGWINQNRPRPCRLFLQHIRRTTLTTWYSPSCIRPGDLSPGHCSQHFLINVSTSTCPFECFLFAAGYSFQCFFSVERCISIKDSPLEVMTLVQNTFQEGYEIDYLEMRMLFGERSQISSSMMFMWIILAYCTSICSLTRQKTPFNSYSHTFPGLKRKILINE